MVALPPPDPYLLVRLANRVDRGQDLSDEDGISFAAILGARSIVNARRDPDAALDVDVTSPGYLQRDIGGRRVFVPAHLASVFPGEPILGDVVESAVELALCHGHPICLSGSTTFLGASRSVSDLDFCEYFLSDPGLIPSAVRLKSTAGRRGPLVRFKCDGSILTAPWGPGLEAAVGGVVLVGGDVANRFKLDFLHTTRTCGLMPTTSVVLPVRETAPEGGNARYSFAYQEAVITTGQPPRSLLSAERLARYLLWLRDDIRMWLSPAGLEKAEDAPLKALKRALSFLLAVGRALRRGSVEP